MDKGGRSLKRTRKSSPDPNEPSAGSSITDPSPTSLRHSMAMPQSFQRDGETVGSKGLIKRHEFLRIITGALYSLGYDRVGALLEEESNIPLQKRTVSLLKQHVMEARWDDCLKTLRTIGLADETMVKSASLLILEQKFLELLKENKRQDAVRVLIDDIAPLANPGRVDALLDCFPSTLPVTPGNCNQDISILNTRKIFLENLLKSLPVTVAISERRLEHLVEKALEVQRDACLCDNMVDGDMSLYLDHKCEIYQIPCKTKQVLQEHTDEVWFLQFSNNGKYLASSSKDCAAIIWEVKGDQISLKHTLNEHERPVLSASWSPDDNQLLTCGMDEAVRRWNVESGQCIRVYEKPGIGMVSCGWLPDGKHIVCGMGNKSICLWEVDGAEDQSWKCEGQRPNVSEMAIVGDQFLSICTQSKILMLNRHTNVWRTAIDELQPITSFSFSEDNKFLLVNVINSEIHLWDMENGPHMVFTFKGHKRGRFIIRSCFGGFHQTYVASGSEDKQVYIWDRATGILLGTLAGHTGAVNCVSWNPKNPHMLASASDDCTIRIWGLDELKCTDNGGNDSEPTKPNGNA